VRDVGVSYEWHDLVGNVGVVLVLGVYLLIQIDRLDARSKAYSVINALGAGLITISLLVDFNLSAFVIEACWFLISLYGLARRWRESAAR
jgi:hypothetical protein